MWWYGTVVLRHRRLIVGLAITAAVVAGVATLLTKRQYVATTVIQPAHSLAAPTGLGALTAQLGIGPMGSGDTPEFYSRLVGSRQLLRDLAMREYVITEPAFKGTLVEYLELEPGGGETIGLAAAKALRNRVKTSIDRVTGVLTIDVLLPNRELAEQAADNVLDLVNAYDLDRRKAQAKAEREFIEEQVAHEQEKLRDAENALARFYGSNRQLAAGSVNSPSLRAQESRLQRRVMQSEQFYTTLAQSYAQAQIEESRNTPAIVVLERPEGFVRPHPRGTVRNAVLALIVGALVAIFIALMREHAAASRSAGSPDYAEFRAAMRSARGRAGDAR